MADSPFIARGFHRHRAADPANRLPPGQYETNDFPVLSAGPTPRSSLATWDFTLRDEAGNTLRWSWDEFQSLAHETPMVDIHCVTKWSKFDTRWEGVSIDTLLAAAREKGIGEGAFVLAHCDGGYTTNLPLGDVTGGKAWVVFSFDGAPLEPEHGGPARLLVPHLYFWKSAKWVRGLRILQHDQPGFWEQLGYHDRGDPWKEQRYQGDP
ncbi:MAG TPA: sulfite oxidase-like oxidoreductase [Gemmatimonadaceae bacterium]|jgi:DMSO/TMAO reductase YedYZ molybdopterin-dependent catalytic subunit